MEIYPAGNKRVIADASKTVYIVLVLIFDGVIGGGEVQMINRVKICPQKYQKEVYGQVIACLLFMTVSRRDAAVEPTWMYSRRVLSNRYAMI
jgi:hypothetical protein